MIDDTGSRIAANLEAIDRLADPDASFGIYDLQHGGLTPDAATPDTVTSLTWTQTAPVTIHLHSGGNSTVNNSTGVITPSADQENDIVFGVGTLSNGSHYVISGAAGVDSGGYYGTVKDVQLSVITSAGSVSTQTLSFSGGAPSPINQFAYRVVIGNTALDNGGMVITDSVSGGASANHYFEILDNTGAVTKSWTALTTDGHANSNAAVKVLPTAGGGFLAVWNENSGSDAYYQRFNASGVATDSVQHFVVNNNVESYYGRVAVDDNGYIMVGLGGTTSDITSSQQYAIYNSSDQLVIKQSYATAESGKLTSPGVIEFTGGGAEDFISLAGGGFLVTVFSPTSNTNPPTHDNMYVQKVSVAGSTVTWGTPAFVEQSTTTYSELIDPYQLSNGKVLLEIYSDGVGSVAPVYKLIDLTDFPANNSTTIDYSTPVIGSALPSGSHVYAIAPDASGGVFAAIAKSGSGIAVQGSYGGYYDTSLYTSDFDPAATNTAPVVDLNGATAGATTLSYTENAAATAIAPTATVTDADSADFSGGSLTVSFTANGTTADQLTIQNQGTSAGQIGVSGSNVTYGGAVIGTFAGGTNGTNLVVTFTTASATPAAAQALAEHILFANTSDNPSTSARTVTFTVVDGDGGSDTGSATATINVTAVNDPAVISGTTTGSVTEAGGVNNGTAGTPTASGTLTDTDVDNAANSFTAVSSATVTTGGHGTYTVTSGGLWTYTLNNNDSSVQALNAGGTLGDTFTVATVDGTAQVVTVTIHGADDAAVAVADGYSVSANATLSVPAGTGVLNNDTDPDGPATTVGTVNGVSGNVGQPFALGSGAMLTLNANGSFSYDPNHHFDALAAAGSGAANASATDTFTYAVDGGANATVTITVNGVDNANTIYQGSGGNDTITGDPTLGGLYHLEQGGNDTVTGGAGNDSFYFGVAYTSADHVNGGAGTNDQIGLEGDYSGGVMLSGTSIVNIEAIALLGGFNYVITTADSLVAAGQTMTFWSVSMGAANHVSIDGHLETDGKFQFFMGAGDDIATGGAGADLFYGEGGADKLTGNGGSDTFAYLAVTDSHGNTAGTAYDSIDFTAGTDKIKLFGTAVTSIDAAATGALAAGSFDSDLAAVLGNGHANELDAGHAVLFTATGGLNGHVFLVVGTAGAANGYIAGQDYVFDVTTGTAAGLTTGDFI